MPLSTGNTSLYAISGNWKATGTSGEGPGVFLTTSTRPLPQLRPSSPERTQRLGKAAEEHHIKEETVSNTHPTSPVEGRVFQAGLDDPEAGATTAEYGIVMLAAVGFAGLLVVILKSEEVRQMLLGLVQTALSTGA